MNTDKPIIVAICGKSATGKDTLASLLASMLKAMNIPANIVLSDTTRPPRLLEENGVNYNFLTKKDFYNKINNKRYLEYTCFNNWFYGTDASAILKNNINIGIFNLEGICNLINYQDQFKVLCVYLKCGLIERLVRSYCRERKVKKEYIRRAYADYRSFKKIKTIVKRSSNLLIFNTQYKSMVEIADDIIWQLRIENILPLDNKLR